MFALVEVIDGKHIVTISSIRERLEYLASEKILIFLTTCPNSDSTYKIKKLIKSKRVDDAINLFLNFASELANDVDYPYVSSMFITNAEICYDS